MTTPTIFSMHTKVDCRNVATFWSRTLAKSLDFALLTGSVCVFDVVSGTHFVVHPHGIGLDSLLGSLALVTLWIAYESSMSSSALQATFGKRAAGIIITDADGHRISLRRSLARAVAQLTSVVTNTTVTPAAPLEAAIGTGLGLAGKIAPILGASASLLDIGNHFGCFAQAFPGIDLGGH